MQAETLTRICPLCRRAAGDASPGTRLCNDCRAMLDPILPRVGVVQPDYAVALAGPATVRPADVHTSFVHDADFDDVSFAPAPRADQAFAPLNEGAAEAFITPDQYEDPDVFIAPDQYEDDVEPPAHVAEPAPAVAPMRIEPAVAEAAISPAPISETAITETAITETTINESTPADPMHLNDAASADPWDDPLPAWEYSHNEWPLLVKAEKPSRRSRSKWPLVALAVVAVVVAAAAYFFFMKPRHEAPPAQQALTVPIEPPAAAPTTPANPTPAPPAAETKEAPPAKEASPAPTNQGADSQWKHALQAMASPNEGEANAFAERLKSAAVPAYVVRADINGHVWYRVRVGRFATAEEATRYAAEARNRARAAGVALKDLQVTAYDKP